MAVLDTEQEQFTCEGIAVVELDGELDIATARDVRVRVAEQLDHGCVVVDLGAVTFIDASGVNALVGAVRDAAERGRHLLLGSPPRQLSRILDVLCLHSVLPTHRTVSGALIAHACNGRARGCVPPQQTV